MTKRIESEYDQPYLFGEKAPRRKKGKKYEDWDEFYSRRRR